MPPARPLSRSPATRAAAALAASLALTAACAAPWDDDRPAPVVRVALPIDAIPTTINGRGPFRLGFDTGQSIAAMLTPALANTLGLAPIGETQVDDGSGENAAPAALYRIDELAIGDETFRDVVAIAFDARHGPDRGEDGLGGSLGFPLFADHLLTVDGGRISFERGELPPADGATVLDYEAPRALPIIEIELAGRRLPAVLDSANPKPLVLPRRLADELPLAAPPRVVGRMSTLFNEFDVLAAELDGDLVIGAHRLAAPTLEFNDLLPDANVGRGLTGRFRVTFDQRNHRVRLLPRGDTPTSDERAPR